MLPALALLAASCFCAAGAPSGDTYTAAERRHWAFQPRAHPTSPSFVPQTDRQWVRTPVDAFILARLRKEGLKPASPASPRTLIRRVYFDLTGLPPPPEEVERFVQDRSQDAWPHLVERLLDSPEYAERWAQHWLDVVRFAESDGFEYDTHRSEAWRYRDYVIRSIREDKPYDQFVREQLAGDEIDPKNDEMLVAAGFHRLGPLRKNAGNQDAAYNRNEILVEMTNVIGSGLLGITIGCARCHDHKLDPIRQKDYYRIQAFFATTHQRDIPLSSPEQQAEWKKKTAAIEAELKSLRAKLKPFPAPDNEGLEKQIAEKEAELPPPLPVLQTVEDRPGEYIAVHVLARGDSAQPGEKVGMRPIGVLLPDDAPEWGDQIPSPRLALAKWITDRANPLTARVMVNRIWQNHFGTGIVSTPNDFGRMGSRPSHPELLDWLADQFVECGFRMKPLHRLILLSSTYQQDYIAQAPRDAMEKDPENKLLWRFPRRRLSAEELRDAMLATSGRLNPQRGGPSVIVPIEPALVKLIYNPAQWAVNPDPNQFNRRSIYVFHKRNLRLPLLEVFDSPDMQLSCPRREQSTHALQALELLNGEFSNAMARALAERVAREAGPRTDLQVDRAFRLALGRGPNAAEKQAALRYLADGGPLSEFALAIFLLNDFLYAN
ncbi:MAG: hypothetical protein DMG59_09160 [Acidobacteria bacterium]|nr:MAG: hypothetical protein DMG59_09160 [Acidobacteriota bacterium]